MPCSNMGVEIMVELNEIIINAKRYLYSTLLKIPENALTENELDLMCLLAKDEDIQKILEENNGK